MSRVVSKRLARMVQSRAGFMCEYCKLPDNLGFADFEVDHIIARAHGGNSSFENPGLSCLFCNLNKGPNLASIDIETRRITNLFHPRRSRWSYHFRLPEGLIIPQTASGPATVVLLKMNLAQTFNLRRAVEQMAPDYVRKVVQRRV